MNKKLRYFAMLLLMAVTSGAWAAVNPLAFKKITETTLVYTTAANLAATGYAQDGKGAQTYNTPSDRGKAMDPTNEESYDFAIGTNGVTLKSAGSNKEVLLYVTNVTMLEVYCKCNSSNDRYPIITATPSDGTAATTVNGSPLNSGATASGKTAVTLDASKNYTISIHSNDADITLYAMRLTALPAAPKITTQPVGAAYATGQTMNPLTVVANTSGGDLSYMWYSCDDAEKTNAAEISGATGASYTPTAAGFYYVTVTDANGSVDSDVVEITVEAAEEPVITEVTGIPDAPVAVGTEVTFTATVTGVPTPTVQWYDASTNDAINGETELTFTPDTSTPGTYSFFVRAENDEGYAVSDPIELVVKEQVATPAFDPNGSYFEDFEKIFITCETEDATILYSTDNGSNWATYEDGIQVTETTTILAKATKDDCIDSESATATFTKVTLLPQTDVTGAATWDWSKFGTKEIKLTEATTPSKTQEFVLANVVTYGLCSSISSDFGDAQALKVTTEYVVRDTKFFQGGSIKFNTTVPGTLSVTYSNTGNRTEEGQRRFLNVNGVNYGEGTMKSGETVTTGDIPVTAGEVAIKGTLKEDNSDQYLRIYKITFTPAETVAISAAGYATYTTTGAIDFTDTGVKAFIVDEATTANVHFAPVTKVPAGTAIVVKGAEGEYTLHATTEATDDVADNLLKTPTEGQQSTGVEYCLANKSQGVGFYPVSQGVAIKKAYLVIEPESNVEAPEFIGFIEDGGTSTGISTVAVENAELNIDAPMYNIAGQRVSRSYKGVVIQNGKKFIVK